MEQPHGKAILMDQLNRMLGIPEFLAAQCAEELMLIALPSVRLAKGLVRADLYFNWRCARVGSIRQDLQHDVHHILSASYCDIYATKEANHANYAHLLLTQETRVCIYNRKVPLNDWLLALN
jgi:hypothetical protein